MANPIKLRFHFKTGCEIEVIVLTDGSSAEDAITELQEMWAKMDTFAFIDKATLAWCWIRTADVAFWMASDAVEAVE